MNIEIELLDQWLESLAVMDTASADSILKQYNSKAAL